MTKRYLDKTKPVRRIKYGGGGLLQKAKNWYDNEVSQTTKDVLSFVPGVGSVIDGIEMMESPSLVNGIGLAASVVGDLTGTRALWKAGKLILKARKSKRVLKALENSPTRWANITSYLTNRKMQQDAAYNLLVDRIKRDAAKQAAIQAQKYDALVNLGQVVYNRLTR